MMLCDEDADRVGREDEQRKTHHLFKYFKTHCSKHTIGFYYIADGEYWNRYGRIDTPLHCQCCTP